MGDSPNPKSRQDTCSTDWNNYLARMMTIADFGRPHGQRTHDYSRLSLLLMGSIVSVSYPLGSQVPLNCSRLRDWKGTCAIWTMSLWSWGPLQEKSFMDIKQELTRPAVLHLYNPASSTSVRRCFFSWPWGRSSSANRLYLETSGIHF